MEVRVSGLRRAAKNIAKNYTEPQKKVREATSNDPWGPSSTLMSEVSDLTYNIEAFAQIMEMLWKRLNDSGKNWRHVYKALVLIDYLIKTGSERVTQQCRENIFAIETLKDFQHYEENKDQGMNVREKAKQIILLLSSEEKLKVERARALKARERFAQQSSGFGSSDSNDGSPSSPTGIHPFGRSTHGHGAGSGDYPRNSEIDEIRPHSHNEEELQLQLALAMSKEEAEQEENQRRSDELRLQMALSQSEQEFKSAPPPPREPIPSLLDLLDVEIGGGASALPLGGFGAGAPGQIGSGDPWAAPQQPQQQATVWGMGVGSNQNQMMSSASAASPWSNPNPRTNSIPIGDPWGTTPPVNSTSNDPWAPKPKEDFKVGSSSPRNPADFLGSNSVLVNLNNLVPMGTQQGQANQSQGIFGSSPSASASAGASGMMNPFGGMGGIQMSQPVQVQPVQQQQPVNPFHLQNPAKPSINEIRQKQMLEQNLAKNINVENKIQNPWEPVGK